MPVSNLPDGYIELSYDRVLKEADTAVLVDFGFAQEWIPESQIYDRFEDGKGRTLVVKEWMAKLKGLI